jgi:hypothetical protein
MGHPEAASGREPPTAATQSVASSDQGVPLVPTHYDLDLEVDYTAAVLRGAAGIVVANASPLQVDTVSLLLYRLLRVGAVHDGAGSKLAFSQAVVPFDSFPKLRVNRVLVTFREPLAPRARTAIHVQYEGPLLGYVETGMAYVQDRIDRAFTIVRDDAFAYPKPGAPSLSAMRSTPEWRFTYSARVTVPKGLTVANGGCLEGVEALGDKVAFRFTSRKPSWRMDFAIAQYTELSFGEVRVYHLPGDGAGAAVVARAAREALDLFSRWFGPPCCPPALTVIEIPDGWGSQTDAPTVIQSAGAFRDPERRREVYHEISHLWNVPATDRPSSRWEEGLASFLAALATQELTGERVVDAWAAQLADRLRHELPDHPAWREVPLVDYGLKDLTGLSYSVGALFFDLLHRVVGRDAFSRILRTYVAGFGVRGGGLHDLVAVMRKKAGADVSRLVHDWLHTTAWTCRIEHNAAVRELAALYGRGDSAGRR